MKLYCDQCDLDQTVDANEESTPSCDNCGRPLTFADDFSVRSDAIELTASRVDDPQSPRADADLTETREEAGPRRIGGYRIIEHKATGGFGSVYRAHDSTLDREVAIKVPKRDRLTAKGAEDFIREAQTLAKLDHPHIVPIYEAGLDEELGLPYIAMKWIDGWTLAGYAKRHQPKLPYAESARIIACVAEGLHYAHKKGFVHRDLKPANILIDREGHPYVTDFGLAIHAENRMATEGIVVGTLSYMPPEQLDDRAAEVDGRADIWSLGIILYELITSARPFAGRGDILKAEILRGMPAPVRQYAPNVPMHLAQLCSWCLQKDVDKRPDSIREVVHGLQNPKILSRRRAVATILSLGAIGGVATGGFAISRAVWNSAPNLKRCRELSSGPTNVDVDPSGKLVTIGTTERSLVEVGEATLPDYKLEFEILMRSWLAGTVGFFIALRDGSYQLFVIGRIPNGIGFSVGRHIAQFDKANVYVGLQPAGSVTLGNLPANLPVRVELRTKDGRLMGGKVNGTSIHRGIVTDPTGWNAAVIGKCGFFVSGTICKFQNLFFEEFFDEQRSD